MVPNFIPHHAFSNTSDSICILHKVKLLNFAFPHIIRYILPPKSGWKLNLSFCPTVGQDHQFHDWPYHICDYICTTTSTTSIILKSSSLHVIVAFQASLYQMRSTWGIYSKFCTHMHMQQ